MPANPRDPQVWFDFAAKDLDRAHNETLSGRNSPSEKV
jgi:hypothetical protein